LSSTQLVVRGSRLVCFLSLVLRIDHSAPGANAVNSNGAWLQKSLLLLCSYIAQFEERRTCSGAASFVKVKHTKLLKLFLVIHLAGFLRKPTLTIGCSAGLIVDCNNWYHEQFDIPSNLL